MPIPDMLRMFARHWWALLLRGVLALLFGLIAFFPPGLTLVTLILLCGFYFVMDGLRALFVGARVRAWSLLLAGALGMIASIVTFVYPDVTAFALLILSAAWAISRGAFEIAAAIRLRKELSNEWLLILGGIVSLLFGIVLVANPSAGALAMVWLIGAYAWIFGMAMCILAFRCNGYGAPETVAAVSRERRRVLDTSGAEWIEAA